MRRHMDWVPFYVTQIQSNGTCRPVAFASRALTSTEVKYAQIEKESLGIVNAFVTTLLVSHFTC